MFIRFIYLILSFLLLSLCVNPSIGNFNTVETTDIITLAGALGGIEGLIQFGKWWLNRKLIARQEAATVEATEEQNDRTQTDWLERRVTERDSKIDTLYRELREAQQAHLEEVHAHHETQLKLTEADCKKCLKRGCPDRLPPSEY